VRWQPWQTNLTPGSPTDLFLIMATGGTEKLTSRHFKDAILAEIFKAYRASGTVYQRATDPETRRTLLDLKRCYDLAIEHLSPLGERAVKIQEELGMNFSDPPAPGGQGAA